MYIDEQQNKGLNGFLVLVFVIIMIVVFWLTGNLDREQNELSRKKFEELVISENVRNVAVVQNKNVPTGRVEIELRGEDGERGATKYLYVSDVNEIQEYLDKREVDYDISDVPQENWFLTEVTF